MTKAFIEEFWNEYTEKYTYTPILCFDVKVTDGMNEKNLYEVTLTVGNDTSLVETAYTVTSGENHKLLLNVKDFAADENTTKYVKISVRAINPTTDKYDLWLYDMLGISDEYTSEELDALVRASRNALSLKDDEENVRTTIIYVIVFIILLLAAVVGGVIFIVLHKEDSARSRAKQRQYVEK